MCQFKVPGNAVVGTLTRMLIKVGGGWLTLQGKTAFDTHGEGTAAAARPQATKIAQPKRWHADAFDRVDHLFFLLQPSFRCNGAQHGAKSAAQQSAHLSSSGLRTGSWSTRRAGPPPSTNIEKYGPPPPPPSNSLLPLSASARSAEKAGSRPSPPPAPPAAPPPRPSSSATAAWLITSSPCPPPKAAPPGPASSARSRRTVPDR